jgi:hypothetical protein
VHLIHGHSTRARKSGASEQDNVWVGLNALAISGSVPAAPASLRVIAMLDIVMIALGAAFFLASVLYVLACERM